MKSLPRAGSFRRKLLESSKEAALAATQIFNNPLITLTTRGSIPQSIKSFILRFDEGLTQAEADSERFSYRLLFQRRLAGKPGQADSVIEFLSPDSELAAGVPTERWVSKEVEKPKYRPTGVVKMAREAGFVSFTVNQHAELWRRADAKNPAKGFGCDVSGY
jgi:hypothetical protein